MFSVSVKWNELVIFFNALFVIHGIASHIEWDCNHLYKRLLKASPVPKCKVSQGHFAGHFNRFPNETFRLLVYVIGVVIITTFFLTDSLHSFDDSPASYNLSVFSSSAICTFAILYAGEDGTWTESVPLPISSSSPF